MTYHCGSICSRGRFSSFSFPGLLQVVRCRRGKEKVKVIRVQGTPDLMLCNRQQPNESYAADHGAWRSPTMTDLEFTPSSSSLTTTRAPEIPWFRCGQSLGSLNARCPEGGHRLRPRTTSISWRWDRGMDCRMRRGQYHRQRRSSSSTDSQMLG